MITEAERRRQAALQAVTDARRAVFAAQEELQLRVDAARNQRLSWNQIAKALGVSRQWAYKKWK